MQEKASDHRATATDSLRRRTDDDILPVPELWDWLEAVIEVGGGKIFFFLI